MIARHSKKVQDVPEGQAGEDFDLSPDAEKELESRLSDSLDAERSGRLLPWETLFPRSRLTG
jgi:hypothetical protein